MPSCLSLMATLKRSSSSESSLIKSVMAFVNASCGQKTSHLTSCQRHCSHNGVPQGYNLGPLLPLWFHSVSHLWTVVRCGLDPDDDLVLQRMWNLVTSEQNLRILQQLTDTQTHTWSDEWTQVDSGVPGFLSKYIEGWVEWPQMSRLTEQFSLITFCLHRTLTRLLL